MRHCEREPVLPIPVELPEMDSPEVEPRDRDYVAGGATRLEEARKRKNTGNQEVVVETRPDPMEMEVAAGEALGAPT